jgi:outer membrane lipoprotein LolB
LQFKYGLFFYCWAALYLSGCASVTSPPSTEQSGQNVNQQHLSKLAQIQHYSIKGRLGVVTQKQGFSGGIDWHHQIANDNIEVFSPLGGKVADIVKTATEVTLTSQDGHSIKANDAETLTEIALGWRLPLSGLSAWSLGRPSNSKIEFSSWDEQGRLTLLKQDGWVISYENYSVNNGYDLPGKIVLKSEKVNLKLLVDKWSDL